MKKKEFSMKWFLSRSLIIIIFLASLYFWLTPGEPIYPSSLDEGIYKYYVMNVSIKNGNDFNFRILEKDNYATNIHLINENDRLKIRVDASQEGTILIVNQWNKRSGFFLSAYNYATLVEIIVATEEIKREWEKIIKEATEKEENLLKPKDVIPKLI